MGVKRKQEERSDGDHASKKRKGFSVGPANLPDGTYRRKTQKIKQDLIQKAKVKKAYAKLKAQEEAEREAAGEDAGPTTNPSEQLEAATMDLHPDRQAMLEGPEQTDVAEPPRRNRRPRGNNHDTEDVNGFRTRQGERKPKPSRYKKELEQAQEKRAQVDARRNARQARENERKAMAKAKRPGRDGKQKLGRQGTVLLSRVQRLVNEGTI
jgi:hypothetical protein